MRDEDGRTGRIIAVSRRSKTIVDDLVVVFKRLGFDGTQCNPVSGECTAIPNGIPTRPALICTPPALPGK